MGCRAARPIDRRFEADGIPWRIAKIAEFNFAWTAFCGPCYSLANLIQ